LRVTSSLWVSALLRRCYLDGATAVVMRRGAEEAGAIFVLVDRLDGTVDLYGPAPQTAFGEEPPTDRLFQLLREKVPGAEADKRLARERDFDPDLWVVAIEDRAGRPFVELMKG
jgi:hypothetical protein